MGSPSKHCHCRLEGPMREYYSVPRLPKPAMKNTQRKKFGSQRISGQSFIFFIIPCPRCSGKESDVPFVCS